MRIIAGHCKGRTLKTREGKGTRPTDARAREMLFNILRERVAGMRVLDLYAGSGAVGLEALSRGARSCLFVEQNAAAADAIRANIRSCDYRAQSQVWQASVRSALHRLSEETAEESPGFDLIFADPPFTRPLELEMLCKQLERALDKAPQMLHNAGMLSSVAPVSAGAASDDVPATSGLLVIQHHRKTRPALSDAWELWQERKAGDSLLSFFERRTRDS